VARSIEAADRSGRSLGRWLSAAASTVPGMFDRWTDDQVLALAPDASSTAAGRHLATPGSWTAAGASAQPAAVWGSCRGSGKVPYRVAVDLAGPAFSCSCPSRKFPCKHALGLLFLWSTGGVPGLAEPPEHVTSWLAGRQERAARPRSAAVAPGERPGLADPDAARRRAEQRERRMLDGLGELDRWLRDQVRSGLAGTDRAGYEPFDALAARLVDAQVPAVAAAVRGLAGTAVSGEGWPARLLEEYALLHLLARAAEAVLPGGDADGGGADGGGADGGLAATVRAHLGVTVPREQVLSTPGERDRWRVLARRDELEERLTVRRVWLRGEVGGRAAVVLTFAMPGEPLDASLAPGTTVDAVVHRYPGGARLRALVGERHGTARAAGGVPGVGLVDALTEWAGALAVDPWLRAWPVVLSGVVPVVDDAGWWLVDGSGAGSLPLAGVGDQGWALLATSGGGPVTLLAEIVPGGVRAVALLPAAASAPSASSATAVPLPSGVPG